MGTRHLTMVLIDGEIRVSQYGQWDGYPSGQGFVIVEFLKKIRNKKSLEQIKENVRSLEEISDEELSKIWVDEGASSESPWVSCEIADKVKASHPEFSRDTGAEILNLIFEGKVKKIRIDKEFAADSLFCEWAYLLDLDKGILEVYRGFNTEPLDSRERFANMKKPREDEKYEPIKLLAKIPFDKTNKKAMEVFEILE